MIHDSKVGIMYFMLMKASGPPLFSRSSNVSQTHLLLIYNFKIFSLDLDQISNILTVALVIVNTVSDVDWTKVLHFVCHDQRYLLTILLFEEVEDWEQLSVIWDQSLANIVSTFDKLLESFQSPAHDCILSCIEGHQS